MPKRKKKQSRPWCWYCGRDFEDEKVLIQHQRAKHYKCGQCGKKLNTTGGLVVHTAQVHKDTLATVPNAMPGRETLEIEIFGMEGIPEQDLMARDAERFAKNNPAPLKYRPDIILEEMTKEQILAALEAHKAGPPQPPPVPPQLPPNGAPFPGFPPPPVQHPHQQWPSGGPPPPPQFFRPPPGFAGPPPPIPSGMPPGQIPPPMPGQAGFPSAPPAGWTPSQPPTAAPVAAGGEPSGPPTESME